MIQEQTDTDWDEMYEVFNMGHRLEMYLPEKYAEDIIKISKEFNIDAQVIGRVEKADKRKYTKGADIAEADINHRKEAEKLYLYLAEKYKKWERIDCVDNGTIRTVESIQKELLACLKNKKVL